MPLLTTLIYEKMPKSSFHQILTIVKCHLIYFSTFKICVCVIFKLSFFVVVMPPLRRQLNYKWVNLIYKPRNSCELVFCCERYCLPCYTDSPLRVPPLAAKWRSDSLWMFKCNLNKLTLSKSSSEIEHKITTKWQYVWREGRKETAILFLLYFLRKVICLVLGICSVLVISPVRLIALLLLQPFTATRFQFSFFYYILHLLILLAKEMFTFCCD